MEIKQGIRRNFARRAASYDRHAAAQRFMARRLLALAAVAAPRPGRILELGCGTGYLTERLRREHPGARLTALDLAPVLVVAARERLGPNGGVAWVVADAETWSRGAFDLIISNAAFQWLTCPGEALVAYFLCLNPGGVLAFSTLGPLTFRELSLSLREAEVRLKPRRVPEIPARGFLTREGWAALLRDAGFSQVTLERRLITAAYPTVRQFLKSLQATGATNPDPRPFSPRLLKAMTLAYQENFRQNGAVPVTYEVIWAVAGK